MLLQGNFRPYESAFEDIRKHCHHTELMASGVAGPELLTSLTAYQIL